jgi:zinc protease
MLTYSLRGRTSRYAVILALLLLFVPHLDEQIATAATQAKSFRLDNGLRVVIVPDHRAGIIAHSVWYRAGSADDPLGQSGLAHFLEHLMFRDADTHGAEEFSKVVARLGGQDEGVTNFDTTYYYQIIARPHLAQVMKLEAQRMAQLRLDDEAVNAEREVVLEELYSEEIQYVFEDQMRAILYYSHPYKTPTIGWKNEVEKLSLAQALAFHRRYYTPNNAIVVIVGNVTFDEVKALAIETYGRLPAITDVVKSDRPQEPAPLASRRIELRDSRVGQPRFQRLYLTPSIATARPGEAEALTLLMNIVADGPNSRLYRTLVIDEKVASSALGGYSGKRRDYGEISISVAPARGRSLADVEAAVDRVLLEIRESGISAEELERAKRKSSAKFTYDTDNQQTVAERYGGQLIIGRTIADVEAWPNRLAKVSAEDVAAAADQYFDARRSVTGFLRPPTEERVTKKDDNKAYE